MSSLPLGRDFVTSVMCLSDVKSFHRLIQGWPVSDKGIDGLTIVPKSG